MRGLHRNSFQIFGIGFLSATLAFCVGCPEPVAPKKITKPVVAPGTSAEEVTELESVFPSQSRELEQPAESHKILEDPFSRYENPFAFPVDPLGKIAARFTREPFRLPKIADLEPQVDAYVARLESSLADLDGSFNFADDAEALYRDACTLCLIAMALGTSPENSKYKKAAPNIIQATLKMQSAKKHDQAKQITAEIKKSLASSSSEELSVPWPKLVPMKPIMRAVPNINTLVKRNLRTEAQLKRGTKRVTEGTAALAVIAQGSLLDVEETIRPQAAKEWEEYCFLFRDCALDLNRRVHDFEAGRGTYANVETSFDAMTDSCNACHDLFYSGTITMD